MSNFHNISTRSLLAVFQLTGVPNPQLEDLLNVARKTSKKEFVRRVLALDGVGRKVANELVDICIWEDHQIFVEGIESRVAVLERQVSVLIDILKQVRTL